MPLARLLRASPTRSELLARPLDAGAQLDGDSGRGRGRGRGQGLDDLLAAAFDACFRGELDTDWDQLAELGQSSAGGQLSPAVH